LLHGCFASFTFDINMTFLFLSQDACAYSHLERALSECPSGLVFAVQPDVPFQSQSIQDRADKVWKKTGRRRITLHECRHTFASLMIAAGANAKTLQIYLGHSTITTTLDRYGHLFPGAEAEFIALADRFLDAA